MDFVFPNEANVTWTVMIVLYPYITGLVAGAFILASLERVFNVEAVRPTYRLSLLTALAFLLDDPPLAAEMGVRGCETYWARFTVERLRREVERLYELALLGCPKRLTAEDGGRVERGEEFTPRPASSPEQPALEGSRRGDCARAA